MRKVSRIAKKSIQVNLLDMEKVTDLKDLSPKERFMMIAQPQKGSRNRQKEEEAYKLSPQHKEMMMENEKNFTNERRIQICEEAVRDFKLHSEETDMMAVLSVYGKVEDSLDQNHAELQVLEEEAS